MKRKRRHFGAKFKTKVVLEALKERVTIQQIASKFELHPQSDNHLKEAVFGERRSGFRR